jgi:hypothetical protein
MSPVANTPQEFCAGATVANIVIQGVNIRWYDAPAGGNPIADTELLADGYYYASQSVDGCESIVRTMVKVIINPDVVLLPPHVEGLQTLCGSDLTLADIVTGGNPNILWYSAFNSTTPLEITTPLADGATYYARLGAGGTCVSGAVSAVTITLGTPESLDPPEVMDQTFCDGALLVHIPVPDNKIVWYLTPTDGEPLPPACQLIDGRTYYAAQVAGDCESATRTPVVVTIDTFPRPAAPATQAICAAAGGAKLLKDLIITGTHIVWYDAETGGTELPETTPALAGSTYWAAQSTGNCEGGRTGITITDECYFIAGTVFPFVHWDEPVFDNLFPVTAKVFRLPVRGKDFPPLTYVKITPPLYTAILEYYDDTKYIPGTPKYPGIIGMTNNPGDSINWMGKLSRPADEKDNRSVSGIGDVPVMPVGWYQIEGIPQGSYLLEISRPGFMARLLKIVVNDNQYIGHKELIGGDLSGSSNIDTRAYSSIKSKEVSIYLSPSYEPRYDFDGDKIIDFRDTQILLDNIGANAQIYYESENYILNY